MISIYSLIGNWFMFTSWHVICTISSFSSPHTKLIIFHVFQLSIQLKSPFSFTVSLAFQTEVVQPLALWLHSFIPFLCSHFDNYFFSFWFRAHFAYTQAYGIVQWNCAWQHRLCLHAQWFSVFLEESARKKERQNTNDNHENGMKRNAEMWHQVSASDTNDEVRCWICGSLVILHRNGFYAIFWIIYTLYWTYKWQLQRWSDAWSINFYWNVERIVMTTKYEEKWANIKANNMREWCDLFGNKNSNGTSDGSFIV